MRYYFRLITTLIKRYKGLIFISTISGIVIFLAVRYFIMPRFRHEYQIIGVTGRFTTQELPAEIQLKISHGLTAVGPEKKIIPVLAEDWEISEDKKTYIFKLKEGLSWQDGKTLTSDDLEYNFPNVVIETPDAKTIIFNLENPYSPFPSIMVKPVFRTGFIGTGEWSVKKLVLNGEFLQSLVIEDGQKNRITYKFYPTDDRTKLAFKLGEVDAIEKMLDPSPFDSWGTTATLNKTTNLNQSVTLFFNTKQDNLEDKTIRQALNYAIDKDGLGERAISPISPTSYFFNPQVKSYEYSLDRAKELIKDIPEEELNKINITLVTTPYLLDTAENISKNWRELGISSAVLVSSIIPSEFQAYLTILDIPPDPDQYPLWHSTQTSNNISGFSNPRIDKLLEDGRAEHDLEARKEIYFDFQRFLNEDVPAIFLYHPEYYDISRK